MAGRFVRTGKILGLAAKLTAQEASHRLGKLTGDGGPLKKLQHQVNQATTLAQSLGQLKGAAMKVGQLLSLEGADFLPAEVVEVLSKLQDSGGTTLDIQRIESILRQELGHDRLARFDQLDPFPCASASIGQVHRGKLGNEAVAVKVQFPGIAESIDSDIALLRTVTNGMLNVTRRDIPLDALFEEFREVLTKETNYAEEARNLERFRELLRDLPAYVIPRTYPEFCTQRVLTMSFEEGLKLKDWIAQNPPMAEREYFGQLVLDLYAIEFFEKGLVQTDPNYGNFLFRASTRQLVLLDFGAVREYTPEFRQKYKALLRLIRGGNRQALVDHAIGMGLIYPGESDECLEAFVTMLRMSIEPFAPARQPFNFGDLDYATEMRNATFRFAGLVRKSPPPRDLIFLHRKLGGIFTLLKTLRVSLPLETYWQRLVG
ncbi:MAG: AarF/ABC1/UbiB kinase family protein [Bdellovibrionales bacterium]|nr:AarF/ABC1/UbiB kinase family protein [Bdellovibrionales bacterium]